MSTVGDPRGGRTCLGPAGRLPADVRGKYHLRNTAKNITIDILEALAEIKDLEVKGLLFCADPAGNCTNRPEILRSNHFAWSIIDRRKRSKHTGFPGADRQLWN
jgi:hypothetical protein